MKIKAIFVDLGGVLIINKGKEIAARYSELGLLGPVIGEIFRYVQTAERTDSELNSYLEKKGIPRSLWNDYTHDFFNSESRNDSLLSILEKAKKNGVLVIYTTNNSAGLQAVIDKYGIAGVADLIINSSEAHVAKPDDAFWQLSLQETQKIKPNLQPSDILVIDDSVSNCESASKNGMQSLVYVPQVSDADVEKILSL